MLLFALFASTVFGITMRDTPRRMFRYGAYCFALFVGSAIVLSWVMAADRAIARVLQFLPIALTKKSAPIIKESHMDLRFCQIAARVAVLFCVAPLIALPATAQPANFFPSNPGSGESEVWSRVAIPPDHPVSQMPQWHIDYAKKQIVCDGNGGHEWLRFDRKFTNFTFHVKWRFTPVTMPEIRNTIRACFSGTIWTGQSGTRRRPRKPAATFLD